MNELALTPTIVIYGFVLVLGLIWGSFFNVCIARIPDRKSLMTRSACPKCQAKIPWYANIPIFSFLYLRGKCLNCRATISIQYPLIEFLTALLFLWLFDRFGLSYQFLSYTVFCSMLLVISVIDIYLQIIPDELSLSGIVLGFIFCFITGDIPWWESLLGILLGGGIFLAIAVLYEKITQREGLGGGDVKLLAMIGAWLGYRSLLPTIVISSALGSMIGLSLMAIQKKDFKSAIPFGPFLAAGAVAYLMWGGLLDTLLLGEPL